VARTAAERDAADGDEVRIASFEFGVMAAARCEGFERVPPSEVAA
jgi:hypothetical protein